MGKRLNVKGLEMCNICLCGSEAGYAHKDYCPYPLFCGTDAEMQAWADAKDDLGTLTDEWYAAIERGRK